MLALPEIGAQIPIGYSGISLACATGIPLTAIEPRITAPLFGAVSAHDTLLEAAKRITIPIEFLLPLDDKDIPREFGLELFDAFASEDKVLPAYPGGHPGVPTDGRIDTQVLPPASGAGRWHGFGLTWPAWIRRACRVPASAGSR